MSLRVDTIQNESGTGPVELYKQSAAKSFGVVNQHGTVAIIDSFNAASVTDDGTGLNTVTFTSSMNNATFTCITGAEMSQAGQTGARVWTTLNGSGGGKTTSLVKHRYATEGGTAFDEAILNYSIHGDLA